MDEVVVVGYGSQKKVNVIGSIASVDSKALESRAVPDVSNMLTGQMSGVTITQESGNPGQDAGTIHIRGVGSFGATPSPFGSSRWTSGSLSDLTPPILIIFQFWRMPLQQLFMVLVLPMVLFW